MFDLISQSMLFLLESLKHIVGNYGLAIIVLTVLCRAALWPVSRSQMRSMKMMQELQPKMKLLQERYKADPQKLQTEMFKLYKDYKFNPLGGCLPMVVQLPLFIGLYWAINNPHFMAIGDPTFLNFIHLKHTGIVSHGGPSFDNKMNVASGGGSFFGVGKDVIIAGNQMTVTLKNGNVLTDQKVPNPTHVLTVLPKEIRPGVPIQVTTTYPQLGLEGYEGLVNTINMPLLNTGTKEMETVTFTPEDKTSPLQASLETVPGKNVVHMDVAILVVLFALTMVLSQKLMTPQTASTGNEQQQQMMKYLPYLFSVFLFIFPIPAGVLLYMDTNSLFQIFQTWMFQRGSSPSANLPPSQSIIDIKPDSP